jgi:hypothetical protein
VCARRSSIVEAAWRPVWDGLAAAEREEILRVVVVEKPYLEGKPRLTEALCLDEWARRRGDAVVLDAGGVPGPETR